MTSAKSRDLNPVFGLYNFVETRKTLGVFKTEIVIRIGFGRKAFGNLPFIVTRKTKAVMVSIIKHEIVLDRGFKGGRCVVGNHFVLLSALGFVDSRKPILSFCFARGEELHPSIFFSCEVFTHKMLETSRRKFHRFVCRFRVCCTQRGTQRLQIVIAVAKKSKKFFPVCKKKFFYFFDKVFSTKAKRTEEKTERSTILTIGKICVRFTLQHTQQKTAFGVMKFARWRTFQG